MRHPTEGVLRRLLDEPAGVADSDRQHVAGCPQCLGGLAAMREDAALVDAALATEGGADVDVDAAWRRLSTAPAAAVDRAAPRSPPCRVGLARGPAPARRRGRRRRRRPDRRRHRRRQRLAADLPDRADRSGQLQHRRSRRPARPAARTATSW